MPSAGRAGCRGGTGGGAFRAGGQLSRFAQGDFVCMAWSPDGPVNTLTAKSEHHVMAFAYNMKTGQARYMAYYGGQEPYYMALDW